MAITFESYIKKKGNPAEFYIVYWCKDQELLDLIIRKVFSQSISKETIDAGITYVCGVSPKERKNKDTILPKDMEKIQMLIDAIVSPVTNDDLFDAIGGYLNYLAEKRKREKIERNSSWKNKIVSTIFSESFPYRCALFLLFTLFIWVMHRSEMKFFIKPIPWGRC